MTKKNFQKLSLITLVIGLIILIISYFTFHFVTDEGITLTTLSAGTSSLPTDSAMATKIKLKKNAIELKAATVKINDTQALNGIYQWGAMEIVRFQITNGIITGVSSTASKVDDL